MDIDILVETGVENETRLIQALLVLPDQEIREIEPGEVRASRNGFFGSFTTAREASRWKIQNPQSKIPGLETVVFDASRHLLLILMMTTSNALPPARHKDFHLPNPPKQPFLR